MRVAAKAKKSSDIHGFSTHGDDCLLPKPHPDPERLLCLLQRIRRLDNFDGFTCDTGSAVPHFCGLRLCSRGIGTRVPGHVRSCSSGNRRFGGVWFTAVCTTGDLGPIQVMELGAVVGPAAQSGFAALFVVRVAIFAAMRTNAHTQHNGVFDVQVLPMATYTYAHSVATKGTNA